MKKIFIPLLIITLFNTTLLFADADDTVKNPIPDRFYSRCENEGTTVLFKYKTPRQYKSSVVYLPYGYDQEDKENRYPVLFLMHGGGGTSTNYMGPAGSPNSLCWIVDNAIQAGLIEPLIIVCPTHNGSFHGELRENLIPQLDEAFNTIGTRESRAFGGFSMGSVATWNAFMHSLDIVKYYIPMSGDSWVCGQTGGKTFPEQTAITLSRAEKIDEYKDFKIFAATGIRDSAYENLTPQIQAMKNIPEVFQYTTKDFSEGNLIYYVLPTNIHSYTHTYEYVYNALCLFFPGK